MLKLTNLLVHRLIKTKLTLFALLWTLTGLALILLGTHFEASGPAWLQKLPLVVLGTTLFPTGALTIALDYFLGKDTEARDDVRTRRIFKEEAPAMRDAVIQGFAFDADDLSRVSSPETLDQIIRNCLAIRLGDKSLASDVYDDLQRQVVRSPERIQGMHVSITMRPWKDSPSTGYGSMFVATVRREYKITTSNPVMRFSCVSDFDEYRELLSDPTSTEVWFFDPPAKGGNLNGSSSKVFDVLQVTINGKHPSMRYAKRATSQTISVPTGIKDGEVKELSVSYTYRALVERHGHMLILETGQLSKGMHVEFNYGDCGIRYVNVVDAIASTDEPMISRTPTHVETPSISVGFDGWVLPKAQVGFVWVLSEELPELSEEYWESQGKGVPAQK